MTQSRQEKPLNPTGYTPTGDLILVEPPGVEEFTQGGLVIPQTVREAQGRNTRIGIVLAMGDEARAHPRLKGIKEGDQVLFPRYAGDELTVNGRYYLILRDESVLGTMTTVPDYQFNAPKSPLQVPELGIMVPA